MPRKGHSESFEPADNKCLLRASDGKKKISTVVSLLHLLMFLCFICIHLWSFAVNAEFSFRAISGQHQRSNQVSNGRSSYFRVSISVSFALPLGHCMQIFLIRSP